MRIAFNCLCVCTLLFFQIIFYYMAMPTLCLFILTRSSFFSARSLSLSLIRSFLSPFSFLWTTMNLWIFLFYRHHHSVSSYSLRSLSVFVYRCNWIYSSWCVCHTCITNFLKDFSSIYDFIELSVFNLSHFHHYNHITICSVYKTLNLTKLTKVSIAFALNKTLQIC